MFKTGKSFSCRNIFVYERVFLIRGICFHNFITAVVTNLFTFFLFELKFEFNVIKMNNGLIGSGYF